MYIFIVFFLCCDAVLCGVFETDSRKLGGLAVADLDNKRQIVSARISNFVFRSSRKPPCIFRAGEQSS